MPFLNINKRITFLSTALILLAWSGWAQTSSITPYSRFGLGELEDRAFGPQYALGGAGVGIVDTMMLNMMNPASYTMVPRHRPFFNVGFRGKFYEFETSTSTDVGRTVYLKNINFGIPIKNRWGLSFGLMPFSSVGYTISTEQPVENVGDTEFLYSGDGGMNRVYTGLAWKAIKKPDHQLSIGANAGFLFGNTIRSREVIFSGLPYLNSRIEETTVVHDFLFDVGLLYAGKINEKVRYSLGATFELPQDLAAERDHLQSTWIDNGGFESVIDTAFYKEAIEGTITLPKKMSYGVMFDIRPKNSEEGKSNRSRRWLIALDYSSRNWEDYQESFDSLITGDNMSTSQMISLGIQFQPLYVNLTARNPKFWEKVHYRMGLRYRNTQLTLDENQLDEYGISFGVGIPVESRGSLSMINFGFDLSQRGTVENNLIRENRLGFHLGLSLSPMSYEKWFVKRKYD